MLDGELLVRFLFEGVAILFFVRSFRFIIHSQRNTAKNIKSDTILYKQLELTKMEALKDFRCNSQSVTLADNI